MTSPIFHEHTPRTMAFDLSATATGVCFPDGSTDTYEPPAGLDEPTRCAWWADTFRILLTDNTPDLVVFEGPFSHPAHPQANNVLLRVHGVFYAALARTTATWQMVPPTVLKHRSTGSGRATKVQMVARAIELGYDVGDDNAADAALLFHGAREGWWES